MYKKDDHKNYISHWYKKEKFVATYRHIIQLILGEDFWQDSRLGKVLPPIQRATLGRPRTKRKKSRNELKKENTKLSRDGHTMYCTICKCVDHNKRICPLKDVRFMLNYV